MENASKALIIAGAILVSILIIGIGMLVYSSIQGTVAEGVSQMSSQEKEIFNNQFTQYEGKRVNGSSVKVLIQKINSNNVANADVDGKKITLTSTAKEGDTGTAVTSLVEKEGKSGNTSAINTARTYTVKITDTDNDGLVDTVNILSNSTAKPATSGTSGNPGNPGNPGT